jgi:fatty acid desaturase
MTSCANIEQEAQMATLTDRVLSTQELRALQGRSNARGAIRLTIHLALLVGAGWLVAISSGWSVLPAVFLLGVVQAALFAPAHETMHQTAFASRRANAIVGWLAASPSLLNLQFYTAFHLAHHRHTQVPGRDPELGVPDPTDLKSYILRLIGIPFWKLRLTTVLNGWRGDMSAYPYVSAAAAPGIIVSLRAMSAMMVGGAILSAVLFGWKTPFLFWILPQVLGQIPLRAYLMAEHTGCTQDRNGLTNTRTTLTNAVVRLLMWDMPFHAEHHLYPSIPFHRLRDAHAQIRDKLGFIEPRGYARWNLALVRQLTAQKGI